MPVSDRITQLLCRISSQLFRLAEEYRLHVEIMMQKTQLMAVVHEGNEDHAARVVVGGCDRNPEEMQQESHAYLRDYLDRFLRPV